MKVVTSDSFVKRDSGLILWDIAVGEGDCPKAGQQVSRSFTSLRFTGIAFLKFYC